MLYRVGMQASSSSRQSLLQIRRRIDRIKLMGTEVHKL